MGVAVAKIKLMLTFECYEKIKKNSEHREFASAQPNIRLC